MTDYSIHPACVLFPMMPEDELHQLAASIKSKGLLEPITVYEGQIIDGRNRLAACKLAGVSPTFTTLTYLASVVDWVVGKNIERRHLDASQRAMLGAELKPFYTSEAKKRQQASGGDHGNQHTGGKPAEAVGANLPQAADPERAPRARDLAASRVNVSPRLVEQASTVTSRGVPELVDAVKIGDVAVSAAATLTRLSPEQQRAVVALGPAAVAQKAKEIRQSPPPTTAPEVQWSVEEISRRNLVEKGATVLANLRGDEALIAWAQEKGLFLRIDRRSDWGNPFLLDADGTRDEVCDAYERYLTDKRSLHPRAEELRGKVLGCWCYPARCHGLTLINWAKR